MHVPVHWIFVYPFSSNSGDPNSWLHLFIPRISSSLLPVGEGIFWGVWGYQRTGVWDLCGNEMRIVNSMSIAFVWSARHRDRSALALLQIESVHLRDPYSEDVTDRALGLLSLARRRVFIVNLLDIYLKILSLKI